MNKKIIIQIKDMSSKDCPELVFSVDMMGSTYGSCSPCSNEEDVKRAVKNCREWAIEQGDKPIVRDYRESATLKRFF